VVLVDEGRGAAEVAVEEARRVALVRLVRVRVRVRVRVS